MNMTPRPLRILILLFLVILFIHAPVYAEQSRVDLPALKKQVEALRGLAFKQEVPVEYFTREQMQDYLKTQIYSKDRQKELFSEEEALKAFGFIEPAFDMKGYYLKLYTEQTAGLYDYETRRFFLARNAVMDAAEGTGPEQAEFERAIIIHELGHALQDQYFDLGRIVKKLQKAPLDEALAGQAVFEGDATYVMFDYMLKSVNLHMELVPPHIFQAMSRIFEPDPSTDAILAEAPPYFREVSFFPYTAGFSLIRSVKKKGSWTEINDLYRSLPVTTAQVLHPGIDAGAYMSFKQLVPGSLPGAGRIITRGCLGEFLMGVLYRQYIGKEQEHRTGGWKGDAYCIYSDGGKKSLQWVTLWKSEHDAGTALGSLTTLYEKRYIGLRWEMDRGGKEMKALKNDGEVITLVQKGDRVTLSDSWRI